MVKVAGISGTTVYLDQPLPFACDSASTFQGVRMSVSLDTDNTASRYRRMRGVWDYTVDGETIRHTEHIDIVKTPFHLVLGERDVETEDPSFGERIGDAEVWFNLREGALNKIWNELMALQVEPDLVRDTSQLKVAAIHWLLALSYFRQAETATFWIERYKEDMDLFRRGKPWYDSDDDQDTDARNHRRIYDGAVTYPVSGESGGALGADGVGSELGRPAVYVSVG